jgi:hypothetical protein
MSENESLLLQCLASTSLLVELSNANFLDSEYFENLHFENEGCKEVLKMSGLGNPAVMQMMLYALLVIPKELLPRENCEEELPRETYEKVVEEFSKRINPKVASLAEEKSSTYNEEDIDYFRHIRNAVAHSRCMYKSEGNKNYVIFSDQKSKQYECTIKIECYKVGLIIMELQKLIIEYYNRDKR